MNIVKSKNLIMALVLAIAVILISSSCNGNKLEDEYVTPIIELSYKPPTSNTNLTTDVKAIATVSPPGKQTTEKAGYKTESFKQQENELGSLDSTVSVIKVFRHFQELASKFIESISDKLKHPIRTVLELLRPLEVPLPSDVSQTCKRHVRLFFRELLDTFIEERNPMEEWSVQMLDAMSKPPPGIMMGTFFWPGSVTQCLNIYVKDVQANGIDENDAFAGEYCRINFAAPFIPKNLSVPLTFTICLPSTCSIDDKRKLMSYATSLIGLDTSFNESMCITKEQKNMDTTAIIISIFMLIPITAVVAATLLECYAYHWPSNAVTNWHSKKEQLGCQFLSRFSVSKGWKALFAEPHPATSNYLFIHGIRCFTISWVVYCHSIRARFLDGPWRELKLLFDEVKNINVAPTVLGGLFAVETFFFLSGFSAVYFFLQRANNSNTTVKKLLMMYLQRYIRLTPSLAYVIAFTAGPWMFMGNGQFWSAISSEAEKCRSGWWSSLLYIDHLDVMQLISIRILH